MVLQADAALAGKVAAAGLTCVFSPRPCASSHGCSMPFWMNTRSSRRSAAVASTILCRSSFLVHTTMGPAGPVTGSFLLMTTCTPFVFVTKGPPTRIHGDIQEFVASRGTYVVARAHVSQRQANPTTTNDGHCLHVT